MELALATLPKPEFLRQSKFSPPLLLPGLLEFRFPGQGEPVPDGAVRHAVWWSVGAP